MQRNVSKGVSVGDGMNRRREKRMKDRPKGSQTGRQKNKWLHIFDYYSDSKEKGPICNQTQQKMSSEEETVGFSEKFSIIQSLCSRETAVYGG